MADDGIVTQISKDLQDSLDDYKNEVLLPQYGDNRIINDYWVALSQRILTLFPLILCFDDFLTEVGIEDMDIAKDLFLLIEECRENYS